MTFKALRERAPVFAISVLALGVATLAAQNAEAQVAGRPGPIRMPSPVPATTPSTNPQLNLPAGQPPALANVYGLINDLNKRISALEQQVGQLKQVNDQQAQQLQIVSTLAGNLNVSLGATNSKVIGQGQEIAAAKQAIAGLTSNYTTLSTKFANHKHPFSYLEVDYWNVSVVKESHVSGDDMQEVAHIVGNHSVPSTTGAPQ